MRIVSGANDLPEELVSQGSNVKVFEFAVYRPITKSTTNSPNAPKKVADGLVIAEGKVLRQFQGGIVVCVPAFSKLNTTPIDVQAGGVQTFNVEFALPLRFRFLMPRLELWEILCRAQFRHSAATGAHGGSTSVVHD
jgi:hypothetical protein